MNLQKRADAKKDGIPGGGLFVSGDRSKGDAEQLQGASSLTTSDVVCVVAGVVLGVVVAWGSTTV